MLERVIYSEFDAWPLHISLQPRTSARSTISRMQAGGAEMLRLRPTNRLCEADLVPSMLVHDGILLELDSEEQVQHAIEIMRKAGTEVCGGLEDRRRRRSEADRRGALPRQAACGEADLAGSGYVLGEIGALPMTAEL